MFCSTIIPTIGRPTLSRAVCSVLDQEFNRDNFEVIVVNDSGKSLREEAWQRSPRVQIIHTNQHNRSVARNTGAAIAKGRYLHFLDDDDWMLPGVFEDFWQLAQKTEAAWLYGAFRLVDNSGNIVVEISPGDQGNCFIQVIFWEWLPLQASFIRSGAFFAVGGFAPLNSLLGGFEDVHLSRQIARYYDMAYLPRIVSCIRVGDIGSTTNYVDMFQQNRQSREKALQMPGAFTRMRASARASQTDAHYWQGRIVYAYLASVKWNVRQRRLFRAFSRISYAVSALIFPMHHLFYSEFWRGVLKPHFPRQGIALGEYKAELFGETSRKLNL